MNKEKGFTLIELMVTVAVIGVLLTVGIPSFQYLMQSNHMSTQTNELVTALSVARSEAVHRNRDVTLEPIDSDWSVGFRVVPDGSNGPIRTFTTSDAVTISNTPDEVRFLGNGSLGFDADPVEFQLRPDNDCLGEMQRTVTVTAGGSVRTERGAC